MKPKKNKGTNTDESNQSLNRMFKFYTNENLSNEDKFIERFRKQKTTKLDDDVQKLARKFRTLSKEVDKQKSKNLEILAIFGALFTFITIQIQQLGNSNKEVAVFIGILTLGGLLLLVGMLVLSATYRQWWKMFISVCCIIFAAIILFAGWKQYNKYLSGQDLCSYLKKQVTLDTYHSSKEIKKNQEIIKDYTSLCR